MPPLPARHLRSNLAIWAVPLALGPAVAGILLDTLPREAFDPGFFGQVINTHYFDTADFDLRTARLKKSKYLTLRVRCYKAQGQVEGYALSAKTEDQKFRVEIDADTADILTTTPNPLLPLTQLLPGDLFARLLELIDDRPLLVATRVHARRWCNASRAMCSELLPAQRIMLSCRSPGEQGLERFRYEKPPPVQLLGHQEDFRGLHPIGRLVRTK